MSKVDMGLTSKEAKDYESPIECSAPEYPYGLRIELNEDSLGKLGKSIADFKMGDEISLSAVASVVSLSKSEHKDGDAYECVDLQITGLELEGQKEDEDSLASKLYEE